MRRCHLTKLLSIVVLAVAAISAIAAKTRAEPHTNDGSNSSKPKVRAITGFVRLEHETYREQIAAALIVLRKVEAEFGAAGYTVETIRLTTQPLGELVKNMSDAAALIFLQDLDNLSTTENFIPNVGPGMLRDSDDPRTMRLLARALSKLPGIQASAIIGADDGVHWKVIRESATLVRYVAANSPHSQGNFRFTATAMLEPFGPFYPGSYHTGAGKQFSIGFEGANVVQEVFAKTHGDMEASTRELKRELTRHAQLAESIGRRVKLSTGWEFMGVDPTPAPLGSVSIGDAIEKYNGAKFGSTGTLTAALIITSAVRAVPVKQIGYSGLMVPVLEDKLLAQRWSEGTYNTDSLLAYSAVCGTGLDTIPLPGDVTEEQLTSIFGDVAALASKWHKPLSARLLQSMPGMPVNRHNLTTRTCSIQNCGVHYRNCT
jgi:uncharacterized protein (UPF0210 family)